LVVEAVAERETETIICLAIMEIMGLVQKEVLAVREEAQQTTGALVILEVKALCLEETEEREVFLMWEVIITGEQEELEEIIDLVEEEVEVIVQLVYQDLVRVDLVVWPHKEPMVLP
jgi:hypothetical protein